MGIKDFFKKIGKGFKKGFSKIPILGKAAGGLDMIGSLVEMSGDLFEELPKFVKTGEQLVKSLSGVALELLKEAPHILKLLPRILDSLVKLLETAVSGVEWTLDPKNKYYTLTALSFLIIIWSIKNNTLIQIIPELLGKDVLK